MANQGRNEFETRNANGNGTNGNGNGNGTNGDYAAAPRTATSPTSPRTDDRQGFYSRATTMRNDRGGYTYGSEFDSTQRQGAGAYSHDFDRARAGMMEDERAVRSHREEEGRQWRDRHPADFTGRGAYSQQGNYGSNYGYGQNYGSGYNQTLGRTDDANTNRGYGATGTNYGNRGNMAYGDMGHPSEEGRNAYGDMGFGGTRQQWQRGTMRGAMSTTPGMGMDANAASQNRRWRRGGQAARDVMTRNPRTARPEDTLQQIAQIMVDEDTGIVPIVEEGNRLVGVVTDRDIVCRLVARGVDLRAAKARDAMTDEVECVTEDTSLHTVLTVMSEHQIRRVPVVARGDRLVGILSIGDVAREADVDEELQDAFEEISSHRGFWSRLR